MQATTGAVQATLEMIKPHVGEQHGIDAARVAAIVEHVRTVGAWDLPPVLVIEDEGNGPTLLDGHHRCAAARALLASLDLSYDMPERIPAYVVSVADYCRLLETHFDGIAPPRLSDLDDYILIDGAPYERRDRMEA